MGINMEIGNRNPYIMNQFAARYAVRPDRGGEKEDFDAALESAEESSGQEKNAKSSGPEQTEYGQDMDYRQFLLEKMEEMRAKIKNGTIQPKIQTGAEAYTEEEWRKLLDKIDAAEEALRQQVEDEIEVVKEAAEDKEADSDTRIITRPDGARILMIRTSFGEISVELSKPDGSAAYNDDVSAVQENVEENLNLDAVLEDVKE